MSALESTLLDPLEDVLDSVGLMEGSMAPLKRTAVGAVIGYVGVTVIQPSFCYDDAGKPYEWRLTSKKDPVETTMVPYWMVAAVPAFILGFLI